MINLYYMTPPRLESISIAMKARRAERKKDKQANIS